MAITYHSFNPSIVTFTDAYISYVIPKTSYNESTRSYYVTVTVCFIIPKPATIDVSVVTNLTDVPVPPIIEKVRVKAENDALFDKNVDFTRIFL